jgi:enoyl-CoA hydratase/carnithine racemase
MLPITSDQAGIVTLRLEQPGRPVIVLDHALIQALEATLKQVSKDATGLILASASERVFIAGADLNAIQDLDDSQLMRYLEYAAGVFARLSLFPFPTVAAINGAALGGGLELAMHCDGLVAAPAPSGKPYPVGLPEAGLAICPGWGGTNLLPARMADAADAIRRTAEGRPLSYDEAVAAGLFDAVGATSADLLPAAARWLATPAAKVCATRQSRDGAPARWIGRHGRAAAVLRALDDVRPDLPKTDAAAAVAACVDTGLNQGWPDAIAAERRHLTRLRHTPGAREAIANFFAKSSAKK